mmetsp:Transcript_34148/g.43862  ORF Transcript_34148/g.43862 Transcript_34148/m.43862 type:complete len:81 (+) Transcript_34148:218-460(+)
MYQMFKKHREKTEHKTNDWRCITLETLAKYERKWNDDTHPKFQIKNKRMKKGIYIYTCILIEGEALTAAARVPTKFAKNK